MCASKIYSYNSETIGNGQLHHKGKKEELFTLQTLLKEGSHSNVGGGKKPSAKVWTDWARVNYLEISAEVKMAKEEEETIFTAECHVAFSHSKAWLIDSDCKRHYIWYYTLQGAKYLWNN